MESVDSVYTILYAEDDPNIRLPFQEFLQKKCSKLYIAQDGEEAWELYNKHTPDLIIADIRMPIINGLELIEKIRKSNKNPKVILLSAHSDMEYFLQAIDLDVDKYILKPVRLRILDREIKKLFTLLRNEEKLQTQQRYIEMVLNAQSSMVILNTHSKALIANQTFLDFVSVDSVEQFIAKYDSIAELFEEQSGYFYPSSKEAWIEQVLAYEVEEHGVPEVIIKGEVFLLSINPLGERDEYIISLSNITNLVKQRQMLISQSRHAVMGEMLGMISHQWRQPLNTIALMAYNLYALKEQIAEDPEKTRSIYDDIQREVQYLSKTIDDFRLFFKDSGQSIQKQLKSFIERAIQILRFALAKHNIIIHIDIDDKYIYEGPENQLEHVFVNLIHNSLDAALEREIPNPAVWISASENERFFKILVKDNAGGIPPEILEYIFDTNFTSKGESGTGLGLHMCKLIIEEQMKGIIAVQNAEEGALFEISLPKSGANRKSSETS